MRADCNVASFYHGNPRVVILFRGHGHGGVIAVTDQLGRPLMGNYRCFAVVGPVGGLVAVRNFSRLQGAEPHVLGI